MSKIKFLILFIFVFSAAAFAAENIIKSDEDENEVKPEIAIKPPELVSPLAAKTFYDIGYELYTGNQANSDTAKQAMTFFNAAISLDGKANYVLQDIINIAWQYPDQNLIDVVQLDLDQYIDYTSDLEVASKAVGYLLERLNSREQRQDLLQKLLHQYQQRNAMFASDLETQLGLLTAETADIDTAQSYLMDAFTANPYNRLAFAKLVEVTQKQGKQLNDIVYLQNLRYAVRTNPLDLTSVLRFAEYAQILGLYEPAAAAYKYGADVLTYISGPNSVRLEIYRPWLLNCYNMHKFDQCRSILQAIHDKGIFDIRSEAIAMSAAKISGNEQSYKTIHDEIETRSLNILSGKEKPSASELADLTWFYSFVADANKEIILDWATKAYNAEPNNIDAASLYAYAQAINNKAQLAQPVLEKIDASTQAAGLAKAIVSTEKQESNSVEELLNRVVNTMPGSFEAQKAKSKMKELGFEYKPPIEPNAFITSLQNDFGQNFFSQFMEPEEMVSLKLSMKGTSFSYGTDIEGSLVIGNKYTEPVIICPDGLLKGNIRVDVRVDGDLKATIPALIVKTVRPSYDIKPRDALFVPLKLETGKLKSLLECYPQALLNLEFTAYMDPQIDSKGQIKCPFNIAPAKAVVTRRKLNLDTHYLQQRLDAIKRGHQGQKATSAQLFAGLLAEQQKFTKSGAEYKFVYAEPELLTSALARCLSENDWVLKVQTIATMLIIKLDYRLTDALSEELNNSNWPVRLISEYILSKNGDEKFKPVLAWMAQNDPNPKVANLAVILSGTAQNPQQTQDKTAVDSNSVKQAEKKKSDSAVDSNVLK